MRNASFILTMAMLAASGGLGPVASYGIRKARGPQMPLTDEELEKLASLEGKEKKAYIKELKAKLFWRG